jgi:hypothetical protein
VTWAKSFRKKSFPELLTNNDSPREMDPPGLTHSRMCFLDHDCSQSRKQDGTGYSEIDPSPPVLQIRSARLEISSQFREEKSKRLGRNQLLHVKRWTDRITPIERKICRCLKSTNSVLKPGCPICYVIHSKTRFLISSPSPLRLCRNHEQSGEAIRFQSFRMRVF